jgi:hypothetical protein
LAKQCNEDEEDDLDDDVVAAEGFQLVKRRPRILDSLLPGTVNGKYGGTLLLIHTFPG